MRPFALEELDHTISSLLAGRQLGCIIIFCLFIVIQNNMHVIDIVKNEQEEMNNLAFSNGVPTMDS